MDVSFNYKALLQKPEWYKKRLEVLKRDNWCCRSCGSKDYLHVHHTFYWNEPVEPWKYPTSSLVTLCAECHEDLHENFDIEIRAYDAYWE